jgi:single-strand DNA-binding protein
MQKVLLIGYLGKDPEVKYSQQGTAVAQFSVAVTDRWKDKNNEAQEHTEWFAVKAFGRRAEVIGDYLHKGSRVYLEGRKHTESWDDKQTGGKNYRDLVYIDRIEFLGEPKGNGNGHHESGDANGNFEEAAITDGDTRVPF